MITFPTIDLTGIKGVLMDLDNTLYTYEPCHRFALSSCAKHFGCDLPADEFKAMYRRFRTLITERLTPQGSCRSRLLAFQGMFEEMGMNSAYIRARQADALYWETFIEQMRLAPDAAAFLGQCRDRQIPVCVVSDMTAEQQVRKLEKLGVTDVVRWLVTSEESGSEKPASCMFEMGLAKLDVVVHEAVMVGDDHKKDIEGAAALGIRAYHVKVLL